MKAQKSHILFFVVLCIIVLVSRFYGLTLKPLHFDEGINGWFSSQVQKLGYYKYDPNNYHGPLYFYVLRLFETLFGSSVSTLRAVPSFFSSLSVLLFAFPVMGSLSWRRWVMAFLLLSPAFVFFGRSGIHEMPFVFFQLVFAVGILRSFETKDRTALNCLMIGLFGMLTLKETFAVSIFSFAVALASVGPRKLKEILSLKDWKEVWTFQQTVLLGFLLWAFVILFTGFFKNSTGLADFFRAFLPWMKTGVHGNGHDKYFFYWIQTLWQAEPLALLGVALAFSGAFSHHLSLRVISVFSLVQLFVYSMIPYKTVWCILTLVWGFYFVIAYQATKGAKKKFRDVMSVAIGLGILFNLWSLYESSYRNPVNLSHPYVYVNSTYELVDLNRFLEQNAPASSRVQVGMAEQWPWPWLLRDYSIVSYESCAKNLVPDVDIYFCDPQDISAIEGSLDEPYWRVEAEFRQDKGSSSFVYLKKSVFPNVPFRRVESAGGGL